jgi:PAS domain S-box-containing protein
VLLANQKAESLLNKKIAEMAGQSIEDVFGIGADKSHVDFLGATFDCKEEVNEKVVRFKFNTSTFLELTWKCILDEGEEYILFIIKDDTANHKKDEKILENNIRLSEIYKVANIGIWEWDKAEDKVTWSEEVYKIKGVDPALPAYPFSEQAQFYTPESWIRLQDAVYKTLTTGEKYELQIDYVRVDGSIRNATVCGGCKRDVSGNIVGLYGTVQDITDKKNAELLVLENESNLKAIIENTTDNIWALNRKFEIIYLNEVFKKGFYRDWGIELKKGINIFDVIPSNLHDSWNARFQEVFGNKRLEYEDFLLIGGKHVYFNVALNPIVLNGEVVGISVFTSNISERKRIENALRESESKLAELVDAAIEGIVISKNGIIINANKPVAELLGYTQEELLGRAILDFVSKDLKDKVSHNLSEGIAEVYDHLAIRKDGTLVPVEIHGKTILDSSNEKIRFTAIRDISERVEAEQALRLSEEKYRKMFENIQDIYFQTNLEGTILEVSPSSFAMLGFTREEVLGTSVLDLYCYAEDREKVLNLIATQGQIKDLEISFYNKAGKIIPLSLNAISLHDQNGNLYGIEGSIRDISSRKAIELEVKKQNITLQIQNKELEQFAYVTSHDLQEPLRTLISISELLKTEITIGKHDPAIVEK